MEKTRSGSLHTQSFRTEALRKSIHFLIALVPLIAAIHFPFAVLLLIAGISGYAIMELLRLSGIKIPLISVLTVMASRERDSGRFVLGPITLGTGALAALLLFPAPASDIAIFALAFGDGFAGLTGALFGNYRPAFLCGKSAEGSFACFAAVYTSAWLVSHSFTVSLAAAAAAALAEALPLRDYDNIVLPLAVGAVVQLVMR